MFTDAKTSQISLSMGHFYTDSLREISRGVTPNHHHHTTTPKMKDNAGAE